MTKQPWTGLHNPDRHQPDNPGLAVCLIEHGNPVTARWCTPDHPCRCCMHTEADWLKNHRAHIGGHTTHNPDRHSRNQAGYQQCDHCRTRCHDGAWCVCCTATEIDDLRAKLQTVRDAKWQHPAPTDGTPCEEHGDPWEAIERVREVCESASFLAETGADELVEAVPVLSILAALDGTDA